MENNLLCPSHKCNLMELLPILMDIDTEEIILLPSQLNKELQMSTEERLTRLSKPTRKYRIYTEVNTFSRTPDIIVFQNFQSGLVYKTTLSFLNLHPVSRHIRVVSGNSPYFKIDGPVKESSVKLAPGMSYTFNVEFLPTEYRNYIHNITIITDTENFAVPVYGLTGQALLNLPDHIKLLSTAVNIASEKKLVLHNFGRTAASFIMSSKDPFFVFPYKYFLQADEFIEITVACKSPNVGHIKDCIYVTYNYIKLMVHVECEVYSLNTYLDIDSILFQDIYMGLKRQQSVTVYNSSNHFIDFKWKLYKSFAVDQYQTSKMITNLEGMKEFEKKRSTKLEMLSVIDNEGHSRIYEKMFEDQVAELKTNNSYLYQNTAFDIIPLEGKILPKKSQTFTVTFAPNKNKRYESWAYLDVTGSTNRLPLYLNGTGIGPYVSLNVKVLNIGDVFLCATHNYEIALKNEGNIPATIVFKDMVSDFDAIIKCVPKKLHLPYQDSCDAFILSFYSELKGTFIETVQFVVKESEEIIQFVLTGNVVCPLLKTDIRGLDFGLFPFGVIQTKEFFLKNDCQVPIEFKIVVEENIDNEVKFDPDRGVVDAYTKQLVRVDLNICRSKAVDTNFKVVMWGSEQYSFSKFIKYMCICPKIKCDPTDIIMKFSFINFDYKRTIILTNEDSVSGFITYTPEVSENNNIVCTLNKNNFEICPNQCEEIELSIMTNILGMSCLPLVFTVAGGEPQELCKIMLDGQGPVISYRPEEIDFNEITLLQTVVKELTLINDSPITATVQISEPPESLFKVNVNETDIMPDEEKIIRVSVYLTDVGKYVSKINIRVQNGESLDVKVFGEGVGHSLLCEPILNSEYNAEELLTHQQFVLPIKMTNVGKRYYKVRWTSYSSIKNLKDKLDQPHAGYCFRIKPEYFELAYLESQVFEIQGHSNFHRHVEEEFFCYALFDKANKIQLVMSFIMKASFVEPCLSIRKPILNVLVAKNDCLELEDRMSLVNNLGIPLNINLSTMTDYFIGHEEHYQSSLSHKLEGNEALIVKIKFAPNLTEKRYKKETGAVFINYMNHPNKVKLDLTTEVCFPTISLNESELEFSCIPLNSYSFKNVIIKNVTFLPATYSWEILEEFFEIEPLPPVKDESESDGKSECLIDFVSKNVIERHNDTLEELFTGVVEAKSNSAWGNNNDYVTEMKKVLLPAVQRFMHDCNEQDLFVDINKAAEYDEYNINNILSIEPFRGQLDPYEYGVVTVGFFPPPNTKIRAKAVCRVNEGENEILSIVGTSCKISYKFNKKYVEFGCQLFCEICENTIILTNNGYCVFNYSITCDNIRESNTDLEPGWLHVSPMSKKLSPNTSVTLTIKYFPGMVGEFRRTFRVVIGYLDPFEIKIHGFAVFSQVFAYIPRSLIGVQPVDLTYKAISVLSTYYHQRLKNISTTGSSQSSETDILSQLDDDWVVISPKDNYPSTMDIDLSIERLLLAQFLMKRSNILHLHTFNRKLKVIPEFKTPPYLLDFGYVVVEKSVCYTVTLLNYGPIVTDVKLVKNGVSLEKNKFRIEYSPKKLDVGETIDLYVIFLPTLKRFQNPDVNVKESFSLVVTHGATIPILINATVTLPRITFDFQFINFGAVHVGQCLRKSLVIRNNGYVPCKWNVDCKKKHIYFVSPTEGELLPGKTTLLDVYFMPTVKDYLSGKLNIYVEGNPMKTTIHMEGYGIGSSLVFNNTELKFGSVLPYTKDNVVMFIVQNISPAPVEFCFADYNQQYAQEKLWINAYFVSHCAKGVLVPERTIGCKLHNTFEDNYFTQVNELRKKLLKIDQGDTDESETREELSEDSVDPLSKYSPSEILRMLNEFVETTQAVGDGGSTDIHDNNDNFHSKMTIVESKTNKPLVSKKLQSGIFVIFHGGPNTEYFKAANWAGIKLKIPVYSIDRLIYESLVENSVFWANEINNLIDEEFEYVATKEDLVPVPEEDEYDTLMRKVYVILNTKKKTKTKISKDKVADKTNRISEKSSAKQTGKKDKDSSTLGDIPVELFEDLIKYKCKSFTNGVIIESLHSDFLRKISVALNSLLCAMGNSKYIHIILLSYTLQNYIKDKEAEIAEKERTMGELKVAEKEKNIKAKLQNKSSPEISESGKSSKKSKKQKKEKSDNEKCRAPLKDLQKDEKDAFDSFQALLADTFDLCQYWDRRSSSRIKVTRSILKADVDLKDDVKESKGTQQKKKISYEETCDEIGLFLWVINHANKEKPINFSENIFKALNDFPNFQEAKKDLAEGFDEAKDSGLFTVITKSDNIDTTKSDFFSISTNDQITDKKGSEGYPLISSMSLLSTKAVISSKKKAVKHHKTIEEKPIIQPKVTENEVAPCELISRRVLQPEEVAYYTFTFCPKTCGKYNHNFTVQMTGLNSDIIINCSGVCELPTIDFNPHVMFPNVVESYRDKAINSNFVYIKDMNVLDFGLVFYDTDKPHKYEYQILLRNISQLPCDVKASLEEKSSYILQSNLLHIDPGQEVYLPISVKAGKSSILESDLCISVKNNPSSQIVNLVTKPCKLDFHIKPKALTFDKVPVACSLKKKIMLCNLSPVNLLWRFADLNWALQIFDISKTEGFLGPFSVFDVTFSYTPLREESHSKKQLAVQVFDLNYSDQVPLFVDYFTVHADSFDCVVEYSDHIDLEEIKGGKEHRVSFTLMNKGQHNTCITFAKIDNPLDKHKHIRKCFEVMNTNETLVPNKLFTGTLIFNPSKPMEFKEVPIFVCNVVECTHSENIMNSIIMKVSAKVFFSSFEISPAADIHFGHQQIFSIKTHTIEMKNTGKFPFCYTFAYIKPEETSTDKPIKKSKSGINAAEKGSKKGSSKKSKENKDDKKLLKKKTKFNVGCFSIQPSEGDIMPNEIAQIEVECTPEKNEEYKEVITLFVSECVDEDTNGRQITLNVIGCEPKLNFHNFKRIFREHFIVDKMENFNVPKIVTSHCIYEASEQTLHFKKVSLNTKAVSNIYMQNKGHVIAYVMAKIDDGNKNVFKVFPNSIDVDPFSTKSLSIIFKPDCVGETSCRLEITYNCSTNNKFSLALIGEGVMPKLMIIEPNLEQNNKSTINFLPTYIGHSRSQRISIKNIGSISAKAILQINNNINEALTLIACEDTYNMLNICDLEEFENTKYSTLVNLQPEEIANFILNYEPKCEESLDAVVKIHTVNNPFEIAQIAVSGQSYYHDICVEGLTPCIIKERNTVGYNIDFDFVFLHYIQRKMFTIKNHSEQYIYKFEFTDFGPLVFTPRVGHLKPLAHKEIIVSFYTRKPQYYDKELVEFTVNKIEYITPVSDILSWDERLKFVTWDIPKIEFSDKSTKKFSKSSYDEENEESLEGERMSIKNTVDRPEPEFKIIPETSEIIPCLFSVIADYSTYINKICDITFPDTYINEKRKTQFEVENDGIVPLEIEWDFFYSKTETTRAVENETDEIKKDLARPIGENSFISTNSSCSYEEEEAIPFTITPQKTSIYPNEAQEFTIEFRPLKYMDHNMILQSTIIGLKPKLKNIQIKVTGKSLLPIYYFELEQTNYLSRRPDGIKKCNSIDYADPKVIEFESVGIGVLSLRKLNIVNPGNESFTYKFDSLEQYPIFSYFECKTGSGLVKEGKKSEVIFTFKSHEFGNFEGYYMFKILEEEINVPFLLAARCRQPVVYFTQSYISIKPTILSVPSSATVKLLNNEDMELFYKFHNESLLNENQDQQLGISPKKGKLQPHSEQIIEITFEAEKSGDVNFSVLCTVEKLPTPLTLNIFAQCEEVFSLISYWDKYNAVMNTLDKDNENIINLGMITPKKREVIKFSVCNKGKTGFFYTVQFNVKPVEHMFYIDVNQKKEFVASNKTSTLIIYLEALRKATLKDFKVKINISYGPTYLLNINAKAETPLVKLSFHTHNFGYCIVQKTKTTYYSVTLELKNIGTRILMLENFYENNEDLTIDFKSGHVQPSATQYITMYFHPMNVGRYEINIPLKVNSVKYVVKIMGEAVDINLQLVKSSDKYIDLGGVLVGTPQHYVVQVINRTPTHVNVFFDLWQKLPFHTRPREKIYSEIKLPDVPEPINQLASKSVKSIIKKKQIEENKKASSKESKKQSKKEKKVVEDVASKISKSQKPDKDKGKDKKKKEVEEVVQDDILEVIEPLKKTAVDFLKISPRDCVQLGPDKKFQFTIDFMPTERIENFSEKIFYEIQDHIEPLCVVKGFCLIPKFVLSQSQLKFSNVVIGLKHTIKTLLRNMGDFKGRFQWTSDKKIDVFSITPLSGFVGPSSEIEICVTFAPKTVDSMYKTKAKCLIGGLEKPLELILEGNSTKVPTPISTLHFSCPVREKIQQQIKIFNKTKERWVIHSFISSEQFSTERELIVEPDTEYTLDVTYKPEMMTTLAPHNATLLLPLPEGKAIIYTLIGQTLPPLPINKIKLDIKCKMYHAQVLSIRNWMNTKQCFNVTTELMTPLTPKCLYKVSGNPLVELFPNEYKDYIWKIFVINEIPLDFKVIFTNIETNEYMYYEIYINVLPCDALETKVVTTCVRKPVDFMITLENPIDYPVTFTVECDLAESIFDQYVTLEPCSRHQLPLQYCPLKSDEITTYLYATCPELGTFTYCVKLIAKPPMPENTVKFKAELGEKVNKSILWNNTFKAAVEFTAKFDHPVFSLEKVPSIPEGESGRLKFGFEPNQLGTIQSKAIVFSPQTGNYVYPLIGECVLPTPKGPFSVKPGGSTQISFVNPFTEDLTFNYYIDSNAFYLKTITETLKAKKSTKIVVNMQALKYLDVNVQPRQITAKLHVEVAGSPMNNIKWVFYIQSEI